MTTHDNSFCRWSFWVRPGTSWAEAFAQNFASPDIQMWPEETDAVPAYFEWASPHLNDTASFEELTDRTTALKAVFDGAMLLACGSSFHPFDLTSLTAADPRDRPAPSHLPLPGDVRAEPFSPFYIQKKVSRHLDPLDDPVARNVFLARYDDVTRSILKYTAVQGLTYLTLYAYRDWMKSGGWDDAKIALEAGWSKSMLSDFTNTANNPAYLGPFSRHGGTSIAPKRPIRLEDAEGPMRKAIGSFLLTRASEVNLKNKWLSISV